MDVDGIVSDLLTKRDAGESLVGAGKGRDNAAEE